MGFFVSLWLLLALPLLAGAASFRAIVLLPDESDLLDAQTLETIQGVDLRAMALPGPEKSLRKQLTPFLEGPCDPTHAQPLHSTTEHKEEIQQIKEVVYRYYQTYRHPFIVINIPPQNFSYGVLQIVVHESKVDKIKVEGNRYLPARRIEQYVNLKAGDPISQKTINNALNFLNRNPFRHVDLFYSPGSRPYTTDLTLKVQDRKSYRFYTGIDNTGVASTGTERVFAGVSWDQMFDLDHTLFYQYTTGFLSSQFHANTLQYIAFLPWQQILDIYGGFSIVRAEIAFPNRKNKGTNIQASARYRMPLSAFTFYSHDLSVGFDYKNTNNTMEFVEFFATVGNTVNLTQLALEYKGKYQTSQRIVEFDLEAFASPAEWLPNQTLQDFSSLRPGAQNKWIYFTAGLKVEEQWKHGFSGLFYTQAQWTANTLLPSEQLGLGGYQTVRGYDERQYNADVGFFCNTELYFPSLSLFRSKMPPVDHLRFLLFFDGGWGRDVTSVSGEKPANFLLGIGPGLRYSWGPYFTTRLDWGIKLHHQAGFLGGPTILHFSVIGSY